MATFKDYLNVYSPYGVQINNEDTRFTTSDIGAGVDFNDEEFKKFYDAQDSATKREMLEGMSNQHAMKIVTRRNMFKVSQENTSKDGLLTQIALGGIAGTLSPSTAVPLGALYKYAQIGSKVNKIVMGAAIGGSTATAANLADEALFDAQGMPTNYGGVAMASMVIGGGLGMLPGLLAGPGGKIMAQNIHKDGDVILQDFAKDNYIIVDEGTQTLLVPKQLEKGPIDKIPGLGDWLSSDITKLYQSDSEVLRAAATRIANATVAQRDANGNYIAIGETGMDFKRKMRGMYNNRIVLGITETFNEYKEKGGTLSRDDFNTQVHKLYTSESNRLANEANAYALRETREKLLKLKEKYKQDKEYIKMEEYFYRDPETKKMAPYTDEVIKADELKKVEYEKSIKEQKQLKEKVAELEAEKKKLVKEMEAQYRAEGLRGQKLKEAVKNFTEVIDSRLLPQINALKQHPKYAPKFTYKPIEVKAKPRKKEVVSKELEASKIKYDEEVANTIATKVDEFYANNLPNFRGADPAMVKAIQKYQDYYDEMLEVSQKLGVKEVMGIKKGRLYSPRTWDFQKVRAYDMNTVKSRLQEALVSDNRNSFKDAADLKETVDELYELFKSKDIESRLGQGIGYLSKTLPFVTKLKARKIHLDDSKLGDLVRNNMEEITGQYHYFNSGIQSVYKAFGTDDLSDIVKALEAESNAKGKYISDKELKALRNAIEDLNGTLRINQFSDEKAWTFARNLMTFNSARLMGGAGGNQLIEMMTVAFMNMSKGNFIFKHTNSWKSAADLLYTEKTPNNGFSRFMVNSGYMETALHTHRVNKIGDTEAGFKEGWLEKALHGVNDFQMKYNGMRYFTAVLEDMTGGAIMDYLIKGNASPDQLARWGLTESDARQIGDKLRKMMKNPDGTYSPENFDLTKLTERQRDKFQLAISRGVDEFVIQADSIHAPTWFKTAGPVLKVLTQFMRFPLIAQEVLVRRGLKEDKAAMIAGMVGSSMAYMGLKYLREQAAINLGLKSEYDAKYDYSSEEMRVRAFKESLNYWANLGMATTIWNYGATAMGQPEIGREWTNNRWSLTGPTGSLFETVFRMAEDAIDGNFATERQFKRFKQVQPLMSIPVISEGAGILAQELGN